MYSYDVHIYKLRLVLDHEPLTYFYVNHYYMRTNIHAIIDASKYQRNKLVGYKFKIHFMLLMHLILLVKYSVNFEKYSVSLKL